jgi:uncharacterized membrane protein
VATVVEHQTQPAGPDPWSVRAIIAADRGIYRFAGRWLIVANLLALPFAVLPLIAPLLRAAGSEALAQPVYAFFGGICHQRADRSFHLYGEKMACCHRCFGVYGGLFLFGLLFLAVRSRLQPFRPLRLHLAALLILPLAIDWLVVAAGVWDGTWYLRLATGLLFALAVCWILLPYLDAGFARMRHDLERRFVRLVAQGRAKPLPGAPKPGSSYK